MCKINKWGNVLLEIDFLNFGCVSKCFVVYRGQDGAEYSICEVTEQAKEYSKWVGENIWRLNKIKMQSDEPMVEMGEQCQRPYECWYCEYCKRLKGL
jgi:hypothetical protein